MSQNSHSPIAYPKLKENTFSSTIGYTGRAISLFCVLATFFISSAAILIVFHSFALSLLVGIGTLFTNGQIYWDSVPDGLKILVVWGPFCYAYYRIMRRELFACIDNSSKTEEEKKKWETLKSKKSEIARALQKYCFTKLSMVQDEKLRKATFYREAHIQAWLIRVAFMITLANGVLFSFITYTHGLAGISTFLGALGLTVAGTWAPIFIGGIAVMACIAYTFLMFNTLVSDVLLEVVQWWRQLVTFICSEFSFTHVCKVIGAALCFITVLCFILLITFSSAGAWTKAAITSLTGLFHRVQSFNPDTLRRVCRVLMQIFIVTFETLFSLVNIFKSVSFIQERWRERKKSLRQFIKDCWDKLKATYKKYKWWQLLAKAIIYTIAWVLTVGLFVLHVFGECGVPSEGAGTTNFFPLFDKVVIKLAAFFDIGFQWMIVIIGSLTEVFTDLPFVFFPGAEGGESHDDHNHLLLVTLGEWADEKVCGESHHHPNEKPELSAREKELIEKIDTCVASLALTRTSINASAEEESKVVKKQTHKEADVHALLDEFVNLYSSSN